MTTGSLQQLAAPKSRSNSNSAMLQRETVSGSNQNVRIECRAINRSDGLLQRQALPGSSPVAAQPVQNKAGQILTPSEKARIETALAGPLVFKGVALGEDAPAAGAIFVLHDTASDPATNDRENEAKYLQNRTRNAEGLVGEGSAFFVGRDGTIAPNRRKLFESKRVTTTRHEKREDIQNTNNGLVLSETDRTALFARVAHSMSAVERSRAQNIATSRPNARDARDAIRENPKAVDAWTVRAFCDNAPVMHADCQKVKQYFNSRESVVPNRTNVEMFRRTNERGAYPTAQYESVRDLYLYTALQLGYWPQIHTHSFEDKGIAGAHNDPRSVDLNSIYKSIAEAAGHPTGTIYGITQSQHDDAERANSGRPPKSRTSKGTAVTPSVSPAPIEIKPKLVVNTPGDSYEQEADRVADQVMRMPEPQVQRQCACGKSSAEGDCSECKKKKREPTGSLQRVASSPVGGIAAPSIVDKVLRSPGSQLPADAKSFMESRFGQDFSHVRIHTDTQAQRSAAAVSARAYTVGSHIVFGSGQLGSHSAESQRLLAHELTHVVQQGGHNDIGQSTLLQRSAYEDIKREFYIGLTKAFKSVRSTTISGLRKLVGLLPASIAGVAMSAVDIVDTIMDVMIQLDLFVVGMAVGFGEGIVGMITGLLSLGYKILTILGNLVSGFFTDDFDPSRKDAAQFVAALVGLPSALKSLITNWMTKCEHASMEDQSLMIGELTGQIEALIATFAVSAARAGTVAKVAAETGEVGQAAATAARGAEVIDIATARAAKIAQAVESSGASGGAAKAAGSAFEGNAARQLSPLVEPKVVPQPAKVIQFPQTAPANDVVAAAKAAPAKSPALGAAAATTGAVEDKRDQAPDVILKLPPQKAVHARLYAALIKAGRLVHLAKYKRDAKAQDRKWIRELRPGGKMEMDLSIWLELEKLGVPEAQRVKPQWTPTGTPIGMEVDHRVELQVCPRGEEQLWDAIFNYELLDQPSNSSSGAKLRANIAAERLRLEELTGDPTWISSRDLRFTKLEVDSGPIGERWLPEQIQNGAHYFALIKARKNP